MKFNTTLFCLVFLVFNAFCQDCELFDLTYEISECGDQEVMIDFNFSGEQTGNNGFSVLLSLYAARFVLPFLML